MKLRSPWTAAVLLLAAGCGGNGHVDGPPKTAPTTPPYDFCVGPDDGTLITMTASDGQQIKGVLLGSGTAGVVFGHQGNRTLCSWLEFAHTLADKGYMALAVDFRGYGGSTLKGGAQKQTSADLDIAAAVAELRTRGAKRIAIVGASLGAIGAAVAAPQITPPIQGIVHISGPKSCCGLDAGAAVKKLTVPIFYIVTKDDPEAADTHELFAATKTKQKKLVEYEGIEHGTDILDGAHGAELSAEILAWLARYAPATAKLWETPPQDVRQSVDALSDTAPEQIPPGTALPAFGRLLLLGRERRDVRRRTLDPLLQRGRGLRPGRPDEQEALHGPGDHVHDARAGLLNGRVVLLGGDADDQVGSVHPGGHLVVDHEPDPAEHLLLADLAALAQDRSDLVGEVLVVSHQVRLAGIFSRSESQRL